MRAKLRMVAPWGLIGPVSLIFLTFGGLMFYWGGWASPQVRKIASTALFAVAAIAGTYRAFVFHPYYRSRYRDWLATTPWTVDKPLPFGPIELDWADAVIPAALILAYGVVPGHESVRIIAVYLFFHCFSLVFSIWGAANHVPAYAALFGLGLMVRLWPHAWPCALTGVVVYLIVYDGLRISLRAFPWARTDEPPDARPTVCGWPYDRLLRDPIRKARSTAPLDPGALVTRADKPASQEGWTRLDRMIVSLLLGWWVSCAEPLAGGAEESAIFLLAVTLGVVVGCTIGRSTIYLPGYAEPISPLGRIRTGRLIIPGYDVVMLPFVLIPAIPLAVFVACTSAGVPWKIAGSLAPASALFVALTCPPELRRWRLVGKHRMTPGAAPAASSD